MKISTDDHYTIQIICVKYKIHTFNIFFVKNENPTTQILATKQFLYTVNSSLN